MDIKINDDGELIVTDNDLELIENVEAIRQDIITRLRTFKGEAFLNKSLGIDYYYVVFNKQVNKETVDFHIRNIIKETQGVISVSGYMSRLDSATRTMTISVAEIATVVGNFSFETDLGA